MDTPNTKELKAYAGKLQEELLNSDSNIRVQQALKTTGPSGFKKDISNSPGIKNKIEIDPFEALLTHIPDAANYLQPTPKK